MRNKDIVKLTKLRTGESGRICSLDGGEQFTLKLSSLGIRIGKEITKKSGMVLKGPIVLTVNGRQVAIGHGMAEHILVEII